MSDLSIGDIAAVAGAVNSAELAKKLFGSTASYIGEELKLLAQNRLQNVFNIFKRLDEKKADTGSEFKGVSPRMLERVINEGSYCEDSVMQDYYAGLLMSSESEFRVDDKGVFYQSIINRLSSMQVRAHYVIYQTASELYHSFPYAEINFQNRNSPSELLTYVGYMDFFDAINPQDYTFETFQLELRHIIAGLKKEGLIDYYTIQDVEYKNIKKTCFLYTPTFDGIELFMWGQGQGKFFVQDFFNGNAIFPKLQTLTLPHVGSIKIDNLEFKDNKYQKKL